jgi:hypothetical protein
VLHSRWIAVAMLGWLTGFDDAPLSPVEARKKVGASVTVEMTVRAAKDRLEKRGEIYLDAEPDFRDPKNFAVVITKAGAASLRQAGIAAPGRQANSPRAAPTIKCDCGTSINAHSLTSSYIPWAAFLSFPCLTNSSQTACGN